MKHATRKCIECGAQTYYTNKDGTPSDTCQNCTWFLESFWLTIAAMNRHIPITGKPRRIKILEYKMERV